MQRGERRLKSFFPELQFLFQGPQRIPKVARHHFDLTRRIADIALFPLCFACAAVVAERPGTHIQTHRLDGMGAGPEHIDALSQAAA